MEVDEARFIYHLQNGWYLSKKQNSKERLETIEEKSKNCLKKHSLTDENFQPAMTRLHILQIIWKWLYVSMQAEKNYKFKLFILDELTELFLLHKTTNKSC